MIVLAAATVLLQSGCSFLFLDRPSQFKSGEKTTCTTTYALPAVDLGFALLHLVSIAILSSATGDAYGGEKNRDGLVQLDISWLIIQGGSALWGFSWVGECQELVGEGRFGTRPVRAAPRPPRRPIEPRAAASPAEPAPPAPPVSPVPSQPDAGAPEAPAPPVPQRHDNE